LTSGFIEGQYETMNQEATNKKQKSEKKRSTLRCAVWGIIIRLILFEGNSLVLVR
jgi:hypothetical protein